MFLFHNGKTKYPSQDTKIPASLALTPLVVQQRQAPVAGAARTTLKHTATIARNNMVSSPGSSPNSSICVTQRNYSSLISYLCHAYKFDNQLYCHYSVR